MANSPAFVRAEAIYSERKGNISPYKMVQMLKAEGIEDVPSVAEMRMYYSNVFMERGKDIRRLHSTADQIETGYRITKHIDRHVEQGNVEAIRSTMQSLLDLADVTAGKLAEDIPNMKIESAVDAKVMSGVVQDCLKAVVEMHGYLENVAGLSAKDATPVDGGTLEGEILPPVRNVVSLREEMKQFG